ncbi:hypothetical protein [Bradyrhizobium sp.]|uniref:hypothetical protein n=1 Tax=Bradyrhizobium sp. TaxID=376 RepID=UPI002D753B48|nr:hypothetical protein [Bradyrhizobium sp.]HZR74541.1 hypothetical protein [Bradyrhizobium sp.]
MRRKLLALAFAISTALAPLAAFADEQGLPTDLASSDCSIVTERGKTDRGQDETVTVLRCKGELDQVVGVIVTGGGQ